MGKATGKMRKGARWNETKGTHDGWMDSPLFCVRVGLSLGADKFQVAVE